LPLLEKEVKWPSETPNIRYATFAFSDDDFRAYRDEKPNVVVVLKLHGTLSHPHTIISSHASVRRLSKRKKETFWAALRGVDTIVFVGYSAKDPDILSALSGFTRSQRKEGEISATRT
jgi:hypothetical protein